DDCKGGLWDCVKVWNVSLRRIPLLASPQGGVAERLIKCCEASSDREAGVVFRLRRKRQTTPAAFVSEASRNFFDDAASPPCGDARRGIRLTPFFYSRATSCFIWSVAWASSHAHLMVGITALRPISSGEAARR